MLRCPLSLPLSKSYGARPTRAAICLRVIFPSSGNRAMSVKASTGPTPGMEVSSSSQSASQVEAAERAAKPLRMEIQPIKLENFPYDFEAAFRDASAGGAQMLLVLSS